MSDEFVPELSWRAWLLLPLCALGLLGIGVPVYKQHLAIETQSTVREREDSSERVPYGGELAPLVDDPRIDGAKRLEINRFHRRLLLEMEREGGIRPRDARLVKRTLELRR